MCLQVPALLVPWVLGRFSEDAMASTGSCDVELLPCGSPVRFRPTPVSQSLVPPKWGHEANPFSRPQDVPVLPIKAGQNPGDRSCLPGWAAVALATNS